jgi:dihydrofolate reductase (trimethoprim resistance protein)
MAAVSKNGIIGNGPDIPWEAKGEQLLFKAITYNQWLVVGRKTFESMGKLPNRKYAVISRSGFSHADTDVLVFSSIEAALEKLATITDHVIISGGGEIYKKMINQIDTLHLSVIDIEAEGDITFPAIPTHLSPVFEQKFASNINYCYQIWQKS